MSTALLKGTVLRGARRWSVRAEHAALRARVSLARAI
jgi:hypothetical protein